MYLKSFLSILLILSIGINVHTRTLTQDDHNNNNNNQDRKSSYSSLQALLINQKPLDCQQFDTDLIECFAYNLFLKNSIKFQGLDPENAVVKPILSKHFTNQTVNIGQNVTFTCETQIDALPMFLFYKLDEKILNGYYSLQNKQDIFSLLDEYSTTLQDKKSFSDYVSISERILIERREHLEDSNKDPMAELETVDLKLLNTVKQDQGYYLCIVANSLKSFRVTYGFLKVNEQSFSTDLSIVEKSFESIFSRNNQLTIIMSLIILLIMSILTMSIFYCCLKYNKNQEKKNLSNSGDSLSKSKFIEKTLGSMKKNFVYVAMPDNLSQTTNNSTLNSRSNKLENNLLKSQDLTKYENDTLLIDSETHLFMNKNDSDYLEENDQWEFQREKLKLGKLIDEGAFGRVYKAEAYGVIPGRYKTTVAVKTVKENATKLEFSNFIKELEIMKSVGKHNNIISLLGCCTRSGPIYAIVEYAASGNLRNYLRSQRPKDYMFFSNGHSTDTEEQTDLGNSVFKLYSSVNKNKILKTKQFDYAKTASQLGLTSSLFLPTSPKIKTESIESVDLIIEFIRYCAEISSGMRYLHSKKVCHRDLAARNILLDEFKTAKIADFGLARDLQENYYYTRKSESPIPVKWMAPETLIDRKVYQNSDIWSFGVLMWEIFTLGSNPYPTVPVEKLFDYLKEGNRMSKPMYCDDELYQLILDCWHLNPELRPSFITINERLALILDKYETKKQQQIKLNEMEKLFDENSLDYSIKLSNQNQLLTNSLIPNLTINPIQAPTSSLLSASSSNSSSIMTLVNQSSRAGSISSYPAKFSMLNSKRITRQSESEDSQYFSGADTSLVYGDGSNYSTESSSVYSNYTVPVSAAAFKEASKMAASLAQSPPSPPPPKSFSKLLNLATAAYQL